MNNEPQNGLPNSVLSYLDEIAERLWSGRATVMVGAGFSKNASQDFPDWNELGDILYKKAHGFTPLPTQKQYLNVLRLAEEVKAAIGRPALENVLRTSIPDTSFAPSDLHVKLLELPWADVFTTNYDTLLERASAKVVTRRYEPVVNKEDIPYATKPRIVKLHGSLPSQRPFVVTEEDYRRYPLDYAPFVNTVRQSLLENTFCLIGFSGDDPNFLQWIGWIRDHLGINKAQKIYMIGAFDLSSAKLQLLAQRGIVVVDLSSDSKVGKDGHEIALEQFFNHIYSKEPESLNWPKNSTRSPNSATSDADRAEDIQKITKEWRQQRLCYPGWLILPHDRRKSLWTYTVHWVDCLPNTDHSTDGADIQYVFELIWRLERCLLPIFDNIAECCEKLLQKYWPFSTKNPPANFQFQAGKTEFQNLPWDEIQQAWLTIALAMLRYYREGGNLSKWNKMEAQIEGFSEHFSAEQKESLNYEKFLLSLFALDLPKTKLCIENWKPNDSQPYWVAKRAAACAEIGWLGEAENSAKTALEEIRKKLNQKVSSSGFSLLSMESYSMLLTSYIKQAVAFDSHTMTVNQDENRQFNDRWNELKSFKCDPLNELELFNLALKNLPIQSERVTLKREFDIGRSTQTLHFRTDEEALKAYTFLRFCEEIGLPYRISNSTTATKEAETALNKISRYSPFWATATLIRLGETKAVDGIFSRESVSKFTKNEANHFVQGYFNALDQCREDVQASNAMSNKNYGIRLAKLLPEVISRLLCKCAHDMKLLTLEFIIKLYGSPDKSKYANVRNLTMRLIGSLSDTEQYNLVPQLLNIPFPDHLNPVSEREFLNPFHLLSVKQKPESAAILNLEDAQVHQLLRQAASSNESHRKWAMSSLTKLHELQLLSSDQTTLLAEAVWHETDQYGLPEKTDFYKFFFLTFPHPENVNPYECFKNYVEGTPLLIQKNEQGTEVAMIGGDIPILHDIIGASKIRKNIWTETEVTKILQRLIEWWNVDKDYLKKEDTTSGFPSILEEFQGRFARMTTILAEVVGPNLTPDFSEDTKQSLKKLFDGMQEYGLPILEAKAACLHIYPEENTELYSQIRKDLHSDQARVRVDALLAILKAITNNTPDSDSETMLGQYLTWSSAKTVKSALFVVVRILNEAPSGFSSNLEEAAQLRLDRLIAEADYNDESSGLNFDEKLELREASSILAGTLWKHYQSNSSPIPSTIEKWHDICCSPDEFAEIRVAWENSSSQGTQKED